MELKHLQVYPNLQLAETESIVSASFDFFNSASPKSAKCFTIPSSDTTPTISELLKHWDLTN